MIGSGWGAEGIGPLWKRVSPMDDFADILVIK
jgi:hypothetical protein